MPEIDPTKRWLTYTVATPLMNLTLGLSKHVSHVRVRETGDCDWDLSRSPGMGEGRDW